MWTLAKLQPIIARRIEHARLEATILAVSGAQQVSKPARIDESPATCPQGPGGTDAGHQPAKLRVHDPWNSKGPGINQLRSRAAPPHSPSSQFPRRRFAPWHRIRRYAGRGPLPSAIGTGTCLDANLRAAAPSNRFPGPADAAARTVSVTGGGLPAGSEMDFPGIGRTPRPPTTEPRENQRFILPLA